MDRNTIAALAKGLVPFVHDVVAPLVARVAEVEARSVAGPPGPEGPPGPKGDAAEPIPMDEVFAKTMVPPDLAVKIASVVQLMHESPPIVQRAAAPAPLSRVVRIDRDDEGSFVPVYAEPRP